MVEVFKTNVSKPGQAAKLVALLCQHFPGGRINFDLQDCDRVLRIENPDIEAKKVISLVQEQGYQCGVLD